MSNDDFNIKVKTFITSHEKESFRFEGKAGLNYKNNKYCISYTEPENHNMGEVFTILEVEQDKIILKRSGDKTHVLNIHKNQTTLNEYETDHGSFFLQLEAHNIKSVLTSKGGEVYFKYTLKVDNEKISENEVFINITS